MRKTDHLRLAEKYWVAGFVDGEGCFSVHHNGARRQRGRLQFSITQNDRRPLDRLVRAFPELDLSVRGPIIRKTNALSTKEYYDVRFSGSKAMMFLDSIFSFLSAPKQEQAKRCLDRIASGA